MRRIVFAYAVLLAVSAPAWSQTAPSAGTASPAAPSGAPSAAAPSTAAPSTAPAQTAASRPRRHRRTLTQMFQDANTTGDGHLTREQAVKLPAVARDFDAIDKDRKGYVTLDDIRAHRRDVRAQRRAARTTQH